MAYPPVTTELTEELIDLISWTDDQATSAQLDRAFDALLMRFLEERFGTDAVAGIDGDTLRGTLRSPYALQSLVYSPEADPTLSQLLECGEPIDGATVFERCALIVSSDLVEQFGAQVHRCWHTIGRTAPAAARLIADSLRILDVTDSPTASSSDTPGLVHLSPALSDLEMIDQLLLEAILASIWRVEAVDRWWGTDHAKDPRELTRSSWTDEPVTARASIIQGLQWLGFLGFWERARHEPELAVASIPRAEFARSGFVTATEPISPDAADRWGLSGELRVVFNQLPERARALASG